MFGVWYGAKLSRSAAQNLLGQQAKAEFALAFADTLFKLNLTTSAAGNAEALQILREDYKKHLLAYIRLRSIVSRKEQLKIDTAWRNYVLDDKNDLPEEQEIYRFKHILTLKSNEHQHLLAAKHINTLLTCIAA